MTVAEFNKIANSLNKKEYLIRRGMYSDVYENNGIRMVVCDGGYTVSLLKDGILYIKDYQDNITEEKKRM